MNRLILAAMIGVAVPIGLSAIALAQPVNSAGAGLPPLPGVVLTRVDVQAQVQARFAAADTNHDGAVTRAELDAYRAKVQADRAATRDAARTARRDALFAALDTNHDGQISKAEFAARPGAMPGPGRDRMGGRRMDGGGMGGGWMGDRWMGARGGPAVANADRRMGAFFAMLDSDRDGRITLDEASSRALALFDRIDTNHDGTITPDERRAARDMGGHGRGRGG